MNYLFSCWRDYGGGGGGAGGGGALTVNRGVESRTVERNAVSFVLFFPYF